MATTREEFYKLLKQILVILVKMDRDVTVSLPRSSTRIDFNPLVVRLDNLLTELQTQSTTLSTLALQTAVDNVETLLTSIRDNADGVEGILTTIDADTGAMVIDLAAIEVLITSGNVDLAALEVLTTAGNVDLAAIEVLLGNIETEVIGIGIDTDSIDTKTAAANLILQMESKVYSLASKPIQLAAESVKQSGN